MSVNSKMTAIANEIRELSGSNEKMGLDSMANILNTENINLTTETAIYTNELAELQTKITALEDALEGKAGSGSNISANAGEWIQLSSLPQTYLAAPGAKTYYLEVPLNTIAFLVDRVSESYCMYYRTSLDSYNLTYWIGCFDSVKLLTDEGSLYLEIKIDEVVTNPSNIYILPIYAME